ncbi:hypothetical protein T265_12399 [Opisthorchis viverrini]|uniref:Tubulin/FtsZ GTPase domain-containing protein n=1 Tax=Opisthorchis viverrini TaxID=6198 RepID=A0A074Z3T9_OPIVI|nr:hypothetical protein T265_12399 [Opisthorchis viverrini]KER18010.1 hypothetical protein T265_12399 [Opisthorchis viverrini]
MPMNFFWEYKLVHCHLIMRFHPTAGNNWAYGFFVHAHNIVEKLETPVQRQLERCDQLDGLLITMSLAGGTGSGVGTKLLL